MNFNGKISPNTVNKILSVTIAIFLWIFVIGGENPVVKERTIRSVPVNLKNLEMLEDNNLTIAGSTQYTVDVKIKGQRTVVDPLTAEDIEVEADLFGYGQGQHYINVTAIVPDNTELVEIRSPRIQVNIEEMIATSKPVNINFANVPEGKEIGGLVIQPTEVEVSGAKSLVDSVAWAFGTVNVSGYEEGKANAVQVELQPLNDGEALVENVRMSSLYADVNYTVMDVKEVPLTLNTQGDLDGRVIEDIEVPQTIQVRGLAKDLEKVLRVVTEPVNLASLELDENESAAVQLTVQLPRGVELSKNNPSLTAVFRCKRASATTMEYTGDEIQLTNLPESMEGEIVAGTYTVTVKGDANLIHRLRKSDITLVVDGSEIREEGEVSLAVQTECDQELEHVSVTPEFVTVRVRYRRNEE